MKKKSFIILVLLLFSISLFPEEIQFNIKKLDKNSVITETVLKIINTEISYRKNGRLQNKSNQKTIFNSRKEQKIIDVLNDIPQKVLINYSEVKEKKKIHETESTVIESVDNKSYLLLKNGKTVKINYKNGRAPSRAESQYVEDDYREYHNLLLETKKLNSQQLSGEKTNLILKKIITRAFSPPLDYNSISRFDIFLKEVKQFNKLDCAVYNIYFETENTIEKKSSVQMKLVGEVIISINEAWPVKINLIGPISVKHRVKKLAHSYEMQSNGSMELYINYNYLQK